jgi:hypothetical protein
MSLEGTMRNVTLRGAQPHGPLDIKRFQLPFLFLEWDCECGLTILQRLVDCISNPFVNEKGAVKVSGSCPECDREWVIPLTITIEVSVA